MKSSAEDQAKIVWYNPDEMLKILETGTAEEHCAGGSGNPAGIPAAPAAAGTAAYCAPLYCYARFLTSDNLPREFIRDLKLTPEFFAYCRDHPALGSMGLSGTSCKMYEQLLASCFLPETPEVKARRDADFAAFKEQLFVDAHYQMSQAKWYVRFCICKLIIDCAQKLGVELKPRDCP